MDLTKWSIWEKKKRRYAIAKIRGCSVCGKPVEGNKITCSPECVLIARTGSGPLGDRQCEHCGNTFHPRSHRSKFCRQECYRKSSQRSVVNTECKICGAATRDNRVTCSRECMAIATGGGPSIEPRSCEICGELFKPRANRDPGRFCSIKCQGIAVRTRPIIRCDCGMITSNTKYCSIRCKKLAEKVTTCHACGTALKSNQARCNECRAHQHVVKWKEVEFVATPYKHCGVIINDARSYHRKYSCDECTAKINHDSNAAGKHRRRARIQGAGRIDRIIPSDVYDRDGWICGICGKEVDRNADTNGPMGPSLDHIIPLSKGGTHTLRNVQVAHRQCNSEKRDLLLGKHARAYWRRKKASTSQHGGHS